MVVRLSELADDFRLGSSLCEDEDTTLTYMLFYLLLLNLLHIRYSRYMYLLPLTHNRAVIRPTLIFIRSRLLRSLRILFAINNLTVP
jgi:hypothetical protein